MWFHLGKLFWPANLTFIYPRWQIDSGAWWQYLFPLGAAALLAATWAIRRWTRAPLAAVLFFGGTLFPVMGFFNLYTFRYSLVADHYQYLASLGIIALVLGRRGVAAERCGRVGGRVLGQMGCVALLAVLAVLSWRQSRMYADAETLYRTTIDRNPDCWMAHNNLGLALAGRGQVDEAIAHYRKALEIKPDDAEAHNNLGDALAGRGQVDEAIAHYRKALEIKPDYAEAHNNLGNALAGRGQVDEAIAHYRKALEIKPDYAEAHNNLGVVLAGRGQVDEAIAHYRKALEIKPDYAEPTTTSASPWPAAGRSTRPSPITERPWRSSPTTRRPTTIWASPWPAAGQVDEAIAHFQAALKLATQQGEPRPGPIRPGQDSALRSPGSLLSSRRPRLRRLQCDTDSFEAVKGGRNLALPFLGAKAAKRPLRSPSLEAEIPASRNCSTVARPVCT